MIQKDKKRTSLKKIFLFDIYYNKMFLANLLMFSMLFFLIYCFSLMLTELPELVRKMAYNDFVTVKNIFLYYFYLGPEILSVTFPFSFVFSMSYSLSSFYSNNNALTLVSSGVPVWRISIGSIFIAIFYSIIILYLSNTVFVSMYQKKMYFEKGLEIEREKQFSTNLFTKDKSGYIYFSRVYLSSSQTLENFIVLKKTSQCSDKETFLTFKQFTQLNIKKQSDVLKTKERKTVHKCFAFDFMLKGERLQFDSKKSIWVAYNTAEYRFSPKNNEILFHKIWSKRELPMLKVETSFFEVSVKQFERMNLRESVRYINNLKYNTVSSKELWADFIDIKFLKPMLIILLALLVSTIGRVFSKKYLLLSSLFTSFLATFASILIVNIGYFLTKKTAIPLILGLPSGYIFILIVSYFSYKRMLT